MLNAGRLGWVAAILEMQGRVDRVVNKSRATPQIRIVVGSKNIAMIDKLAEMTGTKPEERPGDALKDWMQRGCTEHCPEPHVPHAHPWQMPLVKSWSVTGSAAAIVLWNVKPYLLPDSPKKWDLLLSDIKGQVALSGRGAGATVASVRRLAGLGWDIPPEFTRIIEQQRELKGNDSTKATGAVRRAAARPVGSGLQMARSEEDRDEESTRASRA